MNPQVYRNFIFIEKNDFVFTYVPKVACTNWKCIFRCFLEFDDCMNPALAHDRKNSGLVFLSELSDYETVLSNPAIKKYTFVRNPFSRVLSAYLNKVEPFVIDSEVKKNLNDYFVRVFEEISNFTKAKLGEDTVSFYSFLAWLADPAREYKYGLHDEHWVPQSVITQFDKVTYDFVGKLENVAEDSKYILDKLGSDMEFPTQKQVKFLPNNANEKLLSYYGSREVELVREIYKDDFKNFNYSTDI